jgi:NAD-dependent SIR2 family protein deacetylase
MSRADEAALDCLRGLAARETLTRDEKTPSIEEIFTEVWEQQSTGLPIGTPENQWDAGDLLGQLQLHLGSVCGSVRFGRRVRLSRLYQQFLADLAREGKTLTVVSFNYDTLVEEALRKSGIAYSYGPERCVVFVDQQRAKESRQDWDVVPVLKLHGSANWGVCRNCGQRGPGVDLINAFEKMYLPGLRRERCVCNKRFLEPGIVPPVIGKGPALRSFGELWTRARVALQRAREVVVVGYSLPESDRQAAALLQEVRGPLKRPRVTVICGPSGAPESYGDVFGKFEDPQCYFEDFLEARTDP